jgi:hypothetical protein
MAVAHEGSMGGTKRANSRWGIVRQAVQQHKVLRCFRTLRQLSDRLLVDFDQLQYVCMLGGALAGHYCELLYGSAQDVWPECAPLLAKKKQIH